MVAYTTAKGLAQVANSSYIGTWDVPTNANWAAVDAATGQVSSISLSGGNLSLTATQMGCSQLTFNSTLTGNTVVTFPVAIPSTAPVSPITGPYIVYNACSGSSAFTVTLATTISSGLKIGVPPGEMVDVVNDGTNFRFKNLERVGTYWDYAGSSVPNWVSACTVPPYLNCDATTFSSATYPFLAIILGGTTLPDSRGRARFALNQGSSRITSSAGYGIDGESLLAGGGSQKLAQAQFPTANLVTTISSGQGSHTHDLLISTIQNPGGSGFYGGLAAVVGEATQAATLPSMTGTTPTGGSGYNLVPPGYVGGLTLIRAA